MFWVGFWVGPGSKEIMLAGFALAVPGTSCTPPDPLYEGRRWLLLSLHLRSAGDRLFCLFYCGLRECLVLAERGGMQRGYSAFWSFPLSLVNLSECESDKRSPLLLECWV